MPFTTIRFLPLPKLGVDEQTVRVTLSGLPTGFSVEHCSLHVFVGNQELATSASPNRLEVTLDDAHQFLLLRFLATQESATLPPQIIPELLPPTLGARVTTDQRSLTVDLSIDRQGKVVGLMSPANVETFSVELVELLRALRFYPALTNGAPADSNATFALFEFLR